MSKPNPNTILKEKDMNRFKVLFWVLTILSPIACRHLPPLGNLSSNFIVSTAYDTKADFTSYKTFSVRDTIQVYTGNPQDSVWFDQDAQSIISQVRTEMTNRGYTEVPHLASPDLAISLIGLRNTTLFAIPPGWWWGYPGWGSPCYWGYCGGWGFWYPYFYTVSVSTGTFIVEMADLKNARELGKIDILWDAVGSGQVGTSSSFVVQQCLRTVTQGFAQSPYIKAH